MTIGRAALAVAWLTVVPSAAAFAQQPPAPPVRRLEVSFGAGALGGGALGTQDANLRANDTSLEPFRLFSTDTRMGASPALDLRAGVMLTPRYGVEGSMTWGTPELRTSLSGDAEGGEELAVAEDVAQYFFGAALLVLLDELRFGTLTPVVGAGGGYLRQLHEGRTVVEEGRFFQGSVGVRHTFASGGRGLVKGAGVRADGRLYLLDGGIAIEEGLRAQGAVSGSLFVTF